MVKLPDRVGDSWVTVCDSLTAHLVLTRDCLTAVHGGGFIDS